MSKESPTEGPKPKQDRHPDESRGQRHDEAIVRGVAAKEARKIRARRRKDQRIWFGLGMFGVIGWSVVVPTLLGLALGIWIDRTWASSYSFTLMGLIGGLLFGLFSAWYWIDAEGHLIKDEREDKEE
jgi:ATP synthase protein I